MWPWKGDEIDTEVDRNRIPRIRYWLMAAAILGGLTLVVPVFAAFV